MQRGQSCAFAAARCGSALARKTSASLSLALVSKRVLGLRPRLGPRLDWLCLQTSNQFNRHPCDTPRCHHRAHARLPTMQTEPSILSTVGARNVHSIRHAWCIKPPDETRPQPALRSPLPIIIIAHHHRTIPHARRPHVRENRPESNFSPFHIEIIYLDFVGSVCRTILHHAHDVVHHSSATINLDEHPNRPLSPPSP